MDDNLDVSTRFARSLGFFEEGHWSLEAPTLQHMHDLQEDSELGGHLHANHPSSHMGGDQSNSQNVTHTPDVLTKQQQQQQPQFQQSIRRGSLEDPGGHFSYLATAEDDHHDGVATPPPAPSAEEEEAA